VLDITVITPTISTREKYVAEAIACVAGQDLLPAAHLVGVDLHRRGPSHTRNTLAAAAKTEWLFFLDDDDLLDANHFSTIADATNNSDVIYTWCRMENRADWCPNAHFSAEKLRLGNFIPVTAAVRRSWFEQVGGFDTNVRDEDWELWIALLHRGAVFTCIPEVTWTYRFHQEDSPNRSLS
jgi:glycosyltransferase involved in cell wall biosynthesis